MKKNSLTRARMYLIASYILTGLSRHGVSLSAISETTKIPGSYFSKLKRTSTLNDIPAKTWLVFNEWYNKQSLNEILYKVKTSGVQKQYHKSIIDVSGLVTPEPGIYCSPESETKNTDPEPIQNENEITEVYFEEKDEANNAVRDEEPENTEADMPLTLKEMESMKVKKQPNEKRYMGSIHINVNGVSIQEYVDALSKAGFKVEISITK